MSMKALALLSTAALALSACSSTDKGTNCAPRPHASPPAAEAGQARTSAESDSGIVAGAQPLHESPWFVLFRDHDERPQEPGTLPKSFPPAIRGKWRETDGATATAAQCDGYLRVNIGKVLTIREDSYTYFDSGGRFNSVSEREPRRIRALFNTAFADDPTHDELEFRVDSSTKTLIIRNFDTDERSTRTYRRCPR